MAIEFTGSDVLLVVSALGAAGATVVGAWLSNRRPREAEDEPTPAPPIHRIDMVKAELDDFARFAERTFVPREEFTNAINSFLNQIELLRKEEMDARSELRSDLRKDIRDLRNRVDWLASGRVEPP